MRITITVIVVVMMLFNACTAYRFHVLGLSHLPVSRYYNACAFTQKIVRMCQMLHAHNHTVFLYGSEGSDADLADEFIMTHRLGDIRRDFGSHAYNGSEAIGYDWKGYGKGFVHDFDQPVQSTHLYYRRAIAAINERKRDDDFLLCTMGMHHKPVADAVQLHLTVEPGIGYRGSYARYRAYESSYIRYFTLGSHYPRQSMDGNWYHRVIPNYYDLSDFPFSAQTKQGDERYYLFLGRIIRRKGLGIAIDVCTRMNLRLVIAGQGHQGWYKHNRTLYDHSGNSYQLTNRMTFVGYANASMRSKLMRGATAVFTPTLFLEPFCGVAVEAQLSGTPVITSSFGAFTETVEHGRTGYRCSVLADFMQAARDIHRLNRTYVRQRAVRLYSMSRVALLFEKWWRDLYWAYQSTASNGTLTGWHRTPRWFQPNASHSQDDRDEL